MKLILRARGEGKTTELIHLAAKERLCIICLSKEECNRIMEQSKQLGCDIPDPRTFYEFFRGYHNSYNTMITRDGKNIKGFAIDNADMLLQQLAQGTPIEYITMTKEETREIQDICREIGCWPFH